jgi:hypothetical protein
MTTNIFERASRLKIRFPSAAGNLSAEDLWDLPLTSSRGANLNDIAIGLYGRVKNEQVSFVDDVKKPDEATELSFEIVKHVISVKKAENADAAARAERREKKQRLLELMARKEEEQLAGKSLAELRELVDQL